MEKVNTPKSPLSLVFERMPMPPTSNHLYASHLRLGRVIRVPSREYKEYRAKMLGFRLGNHIGFVAARGRFTDKPLSIHCDFFFPYEKIYTLDGRFKRMDVSNRLKAVHDELCEALGIDDCQFLEISARKLVGKLGCTASISVATSAAAEAP